jgi:ArsR family transcriptional regulator
MRRAARESREIPAAQRLVADPERAAQIAEVLKAVAHPLRLRIVALLCQQEQHVNALAERLGLKQAIVSQQLRILRLRRLVEVSRADGFARYRIAEPRLRQLLRCMEGCSVA